ncbi:Transcription termination factor mterf9, chloroplastic [Turnera subulata]|uniref:Transcription termination factor mterf9, chloroplastic n=1 Tax=Turnera subulata TaxID=218843 RepID=A0A9Q0JD53_9ROSI|nr:Transcription termination factor mterf9, chloroplastic [Turnera subulata]
MAVSTLCQFNPALYSHYPAFSRFQRPLSNQPRGLLRIYNGKKRRSFVVLSFHSSRKKRRSFVNPDDDPFPRFDDDDDPFPRFDDEDDPFPRFDDDDPDPFPHFDDFIDEDLCDDDYFDGDEKFDGFERYGNGLPFCQKYQLTKEIYRLEKEKIERRGLTPFDARNDKDSDTVGKEKLKTINSKYPMLSEEVGFKQRWIPLLDYLSTFGLEESDFIRMYERNMRCLQTNVCSAQERLDYLFSVGVKHRDVKRMLIRQPQIIALSLETNLKPHVAFLKDLGIPDSRIGQTIATSPSILAYNIENSLKPTVRYLVEEVGINKRSIGKVVQLSPQILIQRIDISWNTRYMFLSEELGASKDCVMKMITKHPQLLHYSIEDGFIPRINFLRSIGMCNSEILKLLTSLTQVLSLSLEDNLKPKCEYLVNELRNVAQSLTAYPMYLSLSLDQRIRPRHRFLVFLKKAPKGPFPLNSLVTSDENFCQQWAETSLDKYLAFRQKLKLK